MNCEARDLEHASVLFTGYLTEFCDEYDRCGYSQKTNNLSGNGLVLAQSDNMSQQSTSSSESTSINTKLYKENKVLKRGVLLLDKRIRENTQ